jgi:hypothetical protein
MGACRMEIIGGARDDESTRLLSAAQQPASDVARLHAE